MNTIQDVIDNLNQLKDFNAQFDQLPDDQKAMQQRHDIQNICIICNTLINEYKKIMIRKLQSGDDFDDTGPSDSPGQFDPENGEIFDPENEEIFDPEERFFPEGGIPLRAIAEGLYDSYGNRIHPKDSTSVLLSLLSWILKWEQFKEENPDLNTDS